MTKINLVKSPADFVKGELYLQCLFGKVHREYRFVGRTGMESMWGDEIIEFKEQGVNFPHYWRFSKGEQGKYGYFKASIWYKFLRLFK